ncbi:MAG: NapC/NirT family cytochrome c [Myxococcaceae bacterium]
MKYILKALSAFRDFVFLATRQWISAIGVALATIASISFLVILAMELGGVEIGNYRGLISYLILPAIFVVGLLLIHIGIRIIRKREKAGKPTTYPILNFNEPRFRSIALLVLALTVANLMIVSTATYKGIEVMHSDAFCGGTCHNVMQPEAVAHEITPHAHVYCADCHIGEGAAHFARAKLNGAKQGLEFLLGDYSRPVPQPTFVPNQICTRCHATNRFSEDRLHIRKTFDDAEKTSAKTTIFWTLVGGHRDGKWKGAHKHNSLNIRYLSDPKNLKITEVEVTRPDGSTDRFVDKEAKAPEGAIWKEMGCTDCHNRPAHKFSTPESIVDGALGRGAIDKSLPFIRREAVAALKASYPSQDAATKGIPAALNASYAKLSPDLDAGGKTKVEAAGQLLARAWTENNFPDMKVGWGTYVDFFQHDPGCYRCHDKKHVNAKGDAIAQKCSGACHDVIADKEEKPEALDVLYP